MSGPPVFVVGPPRSGTHLLRYCLSQHSRLYVAPETDWFVRVDGNRRLLARSTVAERAAWAVRVMFSSGDPSMADFADGKEDLRARLAATSGDPREMAETGLSWFACRKGKPRWGEKTPFHALYLPRILELFPDAVVLAMDREPKNVVASYIRSGHLPPDFSLAVAQVQACREAVERHRDRVTVVRYEDLVREPRPVLERVAAAVGEPFEEAMLRPKMRDSSYREGIMVHDPDIGIEYEEGEADKWRRVLDPGQAALVDRILGDGDGGGGAALTRARIAWHHARLRLGTAKNLLGFENVLRAATGRW